MALELELDFCEGVNDIELLEEDVALAVWICVELTVPEIVGLSERVETWETVLEPDCDKVEYCVED